MGGKLDAEEGREIGGFWGGFGEGPLRLADGLDVGGCAGRTWAFTLNEVGEPGRRTVREEGYDLGKRLPDPAWGLNNHLSP